MRRSAPLLVTLAIILPGCGDDTPSDSEQVREALLAFATAVEERDYPRLCGEVFAPELLEGLQQIGLPCEVAMRTSLGEVSEPKLTVGEVTVQGDTASAEVRTSAEGQPPSTDTIELSRIGERWQVSALGADPEPSPSPTP